MNITTVKIEVQQRGEIEIKRTRVLIEMEPQDTCTYQFDGMQVKLDRHQLVCLHNGTESNADVQVGATPYKVAPDEEIVFGETLPISFTVEYWQWVD